jgi:hypothetical protein
MATEPFQDPPQCCAQVLHTRGMNFHRPRQCTRYGFVKIEGKWYCSQHDPRKPKKEKKIALPRFTNIVYTLKRLARTEEGLFNKIVAADKEESGLYLEPGSVMQLRNLLLELEVDRQSVFENLSAQGHAKRNKQGNHE